MLESILDFQETEGKMDSNNEALCKTLAQFLANNNLTFQEVRRDKEIADKIAPLVQKEMGLWRNEFNELLELISLRLALREIPEGEGPAYVAFGMSERLPTLDQQERRPVGNTWGRYGIWPID